MSLRIYTLVLCLCSLGIAGESAPSLYKKARKAAARNDYAAAYLLASQAVAADPAKPEYWNFAQAVRSRALPNLKVGLEPIAVAAGPGGAAGAIPRVTEETSINTEGKTSAAAPDPEVTFPEITESELKEARQIRPLPTLAGGSALKSFNLRGDAKRLFEEVFKAYGLSVVFDGDYQAGAPVLFRAENIDWKEAIRDLENVTSSFVVPVSSKVALIAKDTTQKRAEVEPVISVVIPFPEPLSPQEVQEAARAVQSTFDMTKMGIDNGRRLVLFRDRVSRLRPAMQLFQELMLHRGQIVTEVELISVNQDSSLSYGMTLPGSFPFTYVGDLSPLNYKPVYASTSSPYATFGGGRTRFAMGLVGASLFASMSRGQTNSLMKAELLGLDGQAAQLHVGDRYPIITSMYSGAATGSTTGGYGTAPSINFEDLGIVLKITPHLHGTESVTLEIEAEFKALAGSAVNDIPVISERKFATKTRVKYSETAVIAGLVRETLTQSWSGIPVLAIASPFRSNDKSMERTQLLLTVHPKLVNLPPSEFPSPQVWVGSETRPRTVLEPTAN
ncbi:type II secretion system protein GspD [Paludibaculum fermentans]|uniref:Type II and III secretion system protein n=1 Tax=Paludibaculum fermentans TaxID=1473598 RepID=A0A7S7NKB0_PALFE|nr:type II and III secretion system protein [Paludibaculum fermentans]QOY85167.1 type II and III secretion system protein [Paludibaculum fermentans]